MPDDPVKQIDIIYQSSERKPMHSFQIFKDIPQEWEALTCIYLFNLC
jgi:hypothetical protein